jgi:hypothetical protein
MLGANIGRFHPFCMVFGRLSHQNSCLLRLTNQF